MAVQIYYQTIQDIVLDEQLLSKLQPQRRKQLLSFRFEADKKRCAAAGLLLWNYIYKGHPENFTVSYNENGKPTVQDAPFFNLSHSGNFVMLAISDTPVGCDIEQLHKAILTKHVFHPNELAKLSSFPEGDARNFEFLRLWTAKEAFLKAIGTGIDANANTYDLSNLNKINSDKISQNSLNTIFLPDSSQWKIEHYTISDYPEYLSCICYKCLQ